MDEKSGEEEKIGVGENAAQEIKNIPQDKGKRGNGTGSYRAHREH